jgi:hypothetical protein
MEVRHVYGGTTWSKELTDEEIKQLQTGIDPRLIDPDRIVLHIVEHECPRCVILQNDNKRLREALGVANKDLAFETDAVQTQRERANIIKAERDEAREEARSWFSAASLMQQAEAREYGIPPWLENK